MFTGIIETVGQVVKLENEGTNVHITMDSTIGPELKIDQSVSHNGICLTVTQVINSIHRVTAIQETITKTNLGNLGVGDVVNLERCMVANGRFDGHIVQGHVDQIGVVKSIKEVGGSWLFDFEYDPSLGNVTVEKVKELTEKWFGDIPAGEKYRRNLPQEPTQTEERKLEVKADVPLDAFYKCWHIYPRTDKRYYIADLITEILSGGGSSRLFQSLVK